MDTSLEQPNVLKDLGRLRFRASSPLILQPGLVYFACSGCNVSVAVYGDPRGMTHCDGIGKLSKTL